ncbi:MAG: type I DNA topoisomerase [Deltaproteobacteria bacterium]|nr:type I DNA topoisomerase [Deltaproteobacteria bacterium]
MAKNLVIVESPAKAKTLGKYLGRNYTVKASVGHVVDLPKSKLGVDIANDFKPDYAVIHGKSKVIDELKKAAKDKENIYLAPDPDREGEAIAWHIADRLGNKKNIHRVLFNEITKKAVQEAIKHPLKLDRHKFDAQQARRILDRLVGYQLSPLLWDKVRRGLSAGRVQSVAVRLITERERAIRAFVKEEYWTIGATLEGEHPPPINANLFELAGRRLDHKTFRLENEAAATGVVEHLKGADWVVAKVEKSDRKRNPSPPFITSRLQQEASRKLGYQPRRTMGIAQKLYEGVEVGEEGAVGLITYMRTDSTRLSPEAVEAVRGYIGERYGADYVPEKPPVFKSKKNTQDAHEAIRPTSIDFPPERVAPYLEKDELNLYTLIWNRFVACQMEPARLKATTIDIAARDAIFRATGQVVVFDGFMRVYTEGVDDAAGDDEDGKTLPDLKEGDRLILQGDLKPEQHFTQPPPRFSQATLIKELEENGIGRPSTYASIMQTILGKEYVQEDPQKRLYPTELGMLVTDLLVESFPDILNVEFTAGMEETLDGIEEGTQNWVEAMRRFYEPFSKDLDKAGVEMRNVKSEERPTDVKCDQCGDTMVIKWGRRGEFLACRRYPECKSTKNFTRDEHGEIVIAKQETTDEVCDKCGKPMLVRFGRFGKFLGCSGYPECKTIMPMIKPTKLGIACPDCGGAAAAGKGVEGGGEILEKRSRRGKIFYSCNRYPDCTFASWDRPIAMSCPLCQAPFVVEKTTKRAGTVRRCLKEGCDFQEAVGDVSETGT